MGQTKPVVLAVVGDTHCGSVIGLCPAGKEEGDSDDGVKLPDAGRYLPSPAQRWMWDCWMDFWDRVDTTTRQVKGVTWGLHLGDSREGDHHGSTQVISHDEEVQAYVVTKALEPMRQRCTQVYVCKGTEAHVGPGGDDATGRWFGAERHPDTDAWASYEWRLNIHGTRINARHHANMGSLPWTKHSAAVRLASQVFTEYADHAARTGSPLVHPQLVLRGHQHRHSDSGSAQPTRAIFVPAWQFATSFVHRISQTTVADIGGLVVVVTPDGYDVRPVLYTPALSTEVVA